MNEEVSSRWHSLRARGGGTGGGRRAVPPRKFREGKLDVVRSLGNFKLKAASRCVSISAKLRPRCCGAAAVKRFEMSDLQRDLRTVVRVSLDSARTGRALHGATIRTML